jgi:hypothetical protein
MRDTNAAMILISPSWLVGLRRASLGILGTVLIMTSGCATIAPLPAADLSTPGWSIKQGQAVWSLPKHKTELTGELVVAANSNGSSFLQFSKTPFPIITAQTTRGFWQVEFIPEKRKFSGRGLPPERLIWCDVANVLLERSTLAKRDWHFRRTDEQSWEFENKVTGEKVRGYLNP